MCGLLSDEASGPLQIEVWRVSISNVMSIMNRFIIIVVSIISMIIITVLMITIIGGCECLRRFRVSVRRPFDCVKLGNMLHVLVLKPKAQ